MGSKPLSGICNGLVESAQTETDLWQDRDATRQSYGRSGNRYPTCIRLGYVPAENSDLELSFSGFCSINHSSCYEKMVIMLYLVSFLAIIYSGWTTNLLKDFKTTPCEEHFNVNYTEKSCTALDMPLIGITGLWLDNQVNTSTILVCDFLIRATGVHFETSALKA